MRIATFNLENLALEPKGGIAFEDRLAVLRPQLERLRADILCLQEVNAERATKHGPRTLLALDRLLEGTRYQDWHRLVSTNHAGTRPCDLHNLVIISSNAPQEHTQHRHGLVAPCRWDTGRDAVARDLEWDRPLLHGVYGLSDGRRLHVMNVHLRAPRAAWLEGGKDKCGRWNTVADWARGFFMASVKQAGQALEARLVVESIFDAEPEALIALVGDFNATDREAALRLVRGDEEDTGNGHLATRMLVPVERGIPQPSRFSVIHHGHPLQLDHILVSRSLLGALRGIELHNETLGDELVSPAMCPDTPDSYHAPMVAEFGL